MSENTSKKNEIAPEGVFSSLMHKDKEQEEYVRATYYLRQDQIDQILEFSKKSGKYKSEFIRDVLDLVFDKLENEQ